MGNLKSLELKLVARVSGISDYSEYQKGIC